MEALIQDVNWVAVVVGAVLAFLAGWLWYSDSLFGEKWRAGIGITVDDNSPMAHAMLAQGVGTFLLAWVIGITETTGAIEFAVLIALTIAVLMKAGGFFAQHSKYAIMVNSIYVLVMVAIMIATHAVL